MEAVRVPRRWTMDWPVDANGDVLPAYTHDYFLAGPGHTERVDADTTAAFANVASVS